MTEYQKFKENLSRYLQLNKEYPRSILIEVTPLCNIRCVFCPCYIEGEEVTRYRKNKYMTFDQFKRIIDQIEGKFNFQMNFTYSGEPLLNKSIFKMVKYLSGRNIPSVIYSNAMLLTPEKITQMLDSGLDRYIVSFDGATKETYEQIRVGANFEIVISNIKKLIQERKRLSLARPFVEMQFIVNSKNRHEVDLFKKMCEEIGVDNTYIKSLYAYKNTQNQDYIKLVREYFVEDEVARYAVGGNNELTSKDSEPCLRFQDCVITVDGDVLLCCNDLHGKYKVGNAIEEGLKDVWDKEEYKRFRNDVMNKRYPPLCRHCIPSTPMKKDLG